MNLEGFERMLLRSDLYKIATQRAILPLILWATDLPHQGNILEVGSGPGFNAEVLLTRFPDWRFTATDYDSDMVDSMRNRLERFGDRVSFEVADASSLPYPDSSFDVVISIGVGHHIGEWERSIAQSQRVLRPGGTLLMADLLDGFFFGPLRALFPPVRTYGIADLQDALSEAGLLTKNIQQISLLYRETAFRAVAEKPVES